MCIRDRSIITRAQQQRPVEQTPDKVVISKNEVPFDVVVRDKKGRPVKDLSAADFEVYEDGVKQEISSFRFVSSTSAVEVKEQTTTDTKQNSDTVTTAPVKPGEDSGPSLSAVALVFDRLSPESRLRARDAALSYLGDSAKKSELVGVFLTDLSVAVLQPFTSDTQEVKAGIEKASVHASSIPASNSAEARSARDTVARGVTVQSGGVSTAPEAGTEFTVPRAQMALSHLEWLDLNQRDQEGNATAHGLLHIASAFRTLPGRKAVIFFSEGLVLPNNVYGVFCSVINEANRNNVSIYTSPSPRDS